MGTLLDLASLVVVPSGYKEDIIYSVVPTDGSGDLDFTRASDATRVNSAGLIEKVRTNLLLFSEQFDDAYWAKTNSTITANDGIAPNGTTTADKVTLTSISGRVQRGITLTASTQFTASIFVKDINATNSIVRVLCFNNANTLCQASFTLIGSGSVSAISNAVGSISSFGNGWYRCAITFNSESGVNSPILRIITDATGTGFTDGESVLIWGAQLEVSDFGATDYIPTTTAAVSVGMTADVPRLDYLGSSCPSLLLEPQTTALNQFSEQINNAYYTNTRVTITANNTTDPSGYNGADLMVQDAADTNGGAFFRIFSFTAVAHTFSVFAKIDEVSFINLAETSSAGGTLRRSWFNIQNGTLGTINAAHTAKIEDYGNGWYRCSITFTATAGSYSTLTYLSDADNSSNAVVSKGSYFWGVNLTATSYPQSYIPTLGTSVTRVADAASKTGISSLIGQTAGSVFIEFDPRNGTGERRFVLQLGTGTTTIYARIESGGTLTAQILNAGTDYLLTTGLTIPSGTNKFAVAYANNDAVFYLNGTQLATSTSVVVPALSSLYVGSNSLSEQQIGGDVNQALLFKTRLSNTELAQITTL
jgi:hypothetical protein